jgi:hypothetical protein
MLKSAANKQRTYWSDEESAQLAALIDEGFTIAAIAERLNRSPAGVLGRAYFLGLRVRRAARPSKKPVNSRHSTPFQRLF